MASSMTRTEELDRELTWEETWEGFETREDSPWELTWAEWRRLCGMEEEE